MRSWPARGRLQWHRDESPPITAAGSSTGTAVVPSSSWEGAGTSPIGRTTSADVAGALFPESAQVHGGPGAKRAPGLGDGGQRAVGPVAMGDLGIQPALVMLSLIHISEPTRLG